MPPLRTVEVVGGGGGEVGWCLDLVGRGGDGKRREARELGFPFGDGQLGQLGGFGGMSGKGEGRGQREGRGEKVPFVVCFFFAAFAIAE